MLLGRIFRLNWIRNNHNEDNLLKISKKLLEILKVDYSDYFIDLRLLSNPDYPGILSLSSLLNDFNIENVTIKATISELTKIELPAVAHTKMGVVSSPENWTVRD